MTDRFCHLDLDIHILVFGTVLLYIYENTFLLIRFMLFVFSRLSDSGVFDGTAYNTMTDVENSDTSFSDEKFEKEVHVSDSF